MQSGYCRCAQTFLVDNGNLDTAVGDEVFPPMYQEGQFGALYLVWV